MKKRKPKKHNQLNYDYRNGGDIVEDREETRDIISKMQVARKRPDVFENHLRSMGVTETGDDME